MINDLQEWSAAVYAAVLHRLGAARAVRSVATVPGEHYSRHNQPMGRTT